MIIAKFVQCNGCGHKYHLRYNLGHTYPQSASFYCHECGIAITFGYDKDEEIFENITIIQKLMRGWDVVNLHPELPIKSDEAYSSTYFPSLEFIKDYQEEEFGKLQEAGGSIIEFLEQWNKNENDFRLLTEHRFAILERKFSTNHAGIEKIILSNVIEVGRLFLKGKWEKLYEGVSEELNKCKVQANFEQLKNYLAQYKEDFLYNKLYEIFRLYNEVASGLRPTLLTQKVGLKPQGRTSSAKWEKVERVYGDFYEILGELLVIPTAMNNLLARGGHQNFQSPGFSIDDYITTDKAKRCNNFSDNENLKGLSLFYDASLRNGTHHKTAKINKAKQKIILRIGKGGKTERSLTFLEYNEYCNEIFAHNVILLLVYFNMFFE